MPSSLLNAAKVVHISEKLRSHYGPRQRHGYCDALDELVLTILSQNTSDRKSGRADRNLRTRYRTWDEVLNVNTCELYEVIK